MNSMDDFYNIQPKDSPQEMAEVRRLLSANNLELDEQVEVVVLCRRQGRVVACAGLDHSTIKCVAVDKEFRGDSLSLRLGSEVLSLAAARGHFHLFLYSAPHNLRFFRGWGFYPLVEIPERVTLMENSPVAIHQYCDQLREQHRPGRRIGAIVLNANPFTLGHRFLIEQAANACDWLHVFVVREDASLFSYDDRFALVGAGVHEIRNLTLYPGSEYIISRATFPGYFLKDRAVIERSWAAIDLLLFREYIAPSLGVTHRFVGTEPFDPMTRSYNEAMRRLLFDVHSSAPSIAVVELPRLSIGGAAISASRVRNLWARHDLSGIKELVPETTWRFLMQRNAPPTSHVTRIST